MVQFIEIGDKEYPFLFNMRVVIYYMNKQKLLTIDDIQDKPDAEYDTLLDIYRKAMKEGIKRSDSELEALTTDEIENAIEERPFLFNDLQNAFSESNSFKAYLGMDEDEDMPEDDKKKLMKEKTDL